MRLPSLCLLPGVCFPGLACCGLPSWARPLWLRLSWAGLSAPALLGGDFGLPCLLAWSSCLLLLPAHQHLPHKVRGLAPTRTRAARGGSSAQSACTCYLAEVVCRVRNESLGDLFTRQGAQSAQSRPNGGCVSPPTRRRSQSAVRVTWTAPIAYPPTAAARPWFTRRPSNPDPPHGPVAELRVEPAHELTREQPQLCGPRS